MSSKTKVLFLLESPCCGGAENAVVNIANGMSADKYDVTVAFLFKKSVYGAKYPFEICGAFHNFIKVRHLFDNRSKTISFLVNYFLSHYPSLVYHLFFRDIYNIVIAFNEGLPTNVVSSVSIRGRKKVAWLHTLTELSMKGKSKEDLSFIQDKYQRFDKIVAVSYSVADSFSGMFPALADKVRVAYIPVNVAAIRSKASSEVSIQKPSRKLLVSVGRITSAKAYDRYLKVIRSLKQESIDLSVWIIGGGDRSDLEHFCEENLLDNVSFLGNQSNPYPYMKLADWIVLPSLVEGLSIVILEALSLEKAVIATDCGGPREILGDSEYGLLVGNDEESIYRGLIRALTETTLKEEYESRAACRAKVFDFSETIQVIERVFDNLQNE